ncbi:hypothetical protein VCHC37A1_2440B, partial [Vibrio cholerae HC-37A1]
TRFRFWRREA